MPDLSRERRARGRQSLDQRVVFRIDSGGSYNGYGEYVEKFVEWTGWGRRDDANIDSAYELGVGGFHDVGELRLITRFDARIRPGPSNTFTIQDDRNEADCQAFRITLVEEVGRQRYMRLAGVRST